MWTYVSIFDNVDATFKTGLISLLGNDFQLFVYRMCTIFCFLAQCFLFRVVRDICSFHMLVVINRSYELLKIITPSRHFRAVTYNKKRHISLNESIFIQWVIHLTSIKCNPLWISVATSYSFSVSLHLLQKHEFSLQKNSSLAKSLWSFP